jgi:hypothetical protein
MFVLILSTNFVWNISHFKKKWATYYQKCTLVFTQSTGYSCLILMELEFSGQKFRKILKYQISWKSVHWETSCCMRMDRHEAIVAFRNFANAPKNFSQLLYSDWQTGPRFWKSDLSCSSVQTLRQRIKVQADFGSLWQFHPTGTDSVREKWRMSYHIAYL